jgi:hypothetical protein
MGAALVMTRCDIEAMNLHLAEIATQIAPGAHAAILVDQAGWHLSAGLSVPPNISLILPPAKCPELSPQENVWQFIRDNWLSNRVFTSFDDLVDYCCDARNKLVDQPWKIKSLGVREVTGANSRARTCTKADAATARLNQMNHLQEREIAQRRSMDQLAREFAPVTPRVGLQVMINESWYLS